MKNKIYTIFLILLISSQTIACDWSKDIKLEGSSYIYTKSCHIEVGRIIQQKKELERANEERKKQSEKLVATIELKDLALTKADERISNWREETYSQHERLLKQQRLSKYNDWAWFGGGIGLTILSVWAASKIKTK